jgi:hypothetical protein
MNLELMNAKRISVGIMFPPHKMDKGQLTDLYSQINKRYEYAAFTMLPDGARLAHGENELFIQHTRLQMNETIATHFDFAKQKTIDLFGMIASRLGIQRFLAFRTKLVAFLPFEPPATAAQFLEANLLKVSEAQFDKLGPGRRGTGIRISMHKDGIYEIRVEPFLANVGQMYIELDIQFPEVFTAVGDIDAKMTKAYDFLFGNVKDFVASFGDQA